MEKKKLLGSQRELLFIRKANVEKAEAALQNSLIRVSKELGIPEEELPEWQVDEKAEYFEKIGPGKKNPKKGLPKDV